MIGEQRAFSGNAVDIGRAITHRSAVIDTEVKVTYVVGHDHENVRLVGRVGVDDNNHVYKHCTQYDGCTPFHEVSPGSK